jgi:LPS sulfotransferase NodH
MTDHNKLVVVLFTGHVGSSWFTSLLASHPSICQIGFEPVDDLTENGMAAKPYFERLLDGDKPDSFPSDVAEFFQKKTKSSHNTPQNTWGIENPEACKYFLFKARLNLSVQLDFFRDFLPSENTTLILLRRRNKIKNAVSQYKRTQLKISHLDNLEQIKPKRMPIVLDPAYIYQQAIKFTLSELKLKHYCAFLNEHFGINCIEVHYEDLLSSGTRSSLFNSIFMTLGLTGSQLFSRYEKMTSNLLSEAVTNFSELSNLISKTDFAPYLVNDGYDIVDEIYSGQLIFPPALNDTGIHFLENLRELSLSET